MEKKKERGKEKLEVGRLFKEGGEEKGKGKTRSGEDFQRGRQKRKGGRNGISKK